MTRPVVSVLLLAGARDFAAGAAQDVAWVGQRVRQWQPTAHEKTREGSGWARNIRAAIATGKEVPAPRVPLHAGQPDGRPPLPRRLARGLCCSTASPLPGAKGE